ncbi:NAD-dependent epimerase/dehydratase family protein [Bacillus pseudomycoides]|uniref:NAD-dependent epimerase/dehydratase family protein n=1 Tax=Bacillus pseudomycoides TaxID=64104 RepID=UPI0015CF3AAE|nr:NAD-dependent epimerase/dehydratase family protein [Bacillus pseudomycoides]
MFTVLVMGGTEFVSKSVVKELIVRGFQVDFITRGLKVVNFDGYHEHIICDRHNQEMLKKYLMNKEYDYVIDVSAYTKEDVEMLLNSLHLASLKKYILLSSGAVYNDNYQVLTEETPRGWNINWKEYGLHKKEAEDYLFEEKTVPFVIFRPTYIYGKGNNLYRENYFFDCAFNEQSIFLPNSKNEEQFIYIDDLTNILIAALTNEKVNGKAFNVTHPETVTWIELTKIFERITSKEITVQQIDEEIITALNLSVRDYFPFRDVPYVMDISKLCEHELPVPKIDLLQGLQYSLSIYEKGNFDMKEQFPHLDELKEKMCIFE